jgi:hypothetical protein
MDDLYVNLLHIRESSVRPFDPVQPAHTLRGQMEPILYPGSIPACPD